MIAWQHKLIGRSLEKSSLLFALNEVFQKLKLLMAVLRGRGKS